MRSRPAHAPAGRSGTAAPKSPWPPCRWASCGASGRPDEDLDREPPPARARAGVPRHLPGRPDGGVGGGKLESPARARSGSPGRRPAAARRGRGAGPGAPRVGGGRGPARGLRALGDGAARRHRPRGAAGRGGGADRAPRHSGAGGHQRGDRDRQALRLPRLGPLRERRARPHRADPAARGAVMLHAIVSDVHGNLEALEAVLADIERHRPASIVCLGDFVGYGASPNECIARLRPMIEHAVAGNHDLAACGRLQLTYFNVHAAMAAQWTETTLTPEHKTYLQSLPFAVKWRDTLLVHASPAEPEHWHYVLSPVEAE